MNRISRRTFARHATAATAGAIAVGSARSAAATPEVVPPWMPDPRTDMTVAFRSLFANRCPLMARFPWVPVERVDFHMGGHGTVVLGSGPEGEREFAAFPKTTKQWCQEFRYPVVMETGYSDMDTQFRNLAEAAEKYAYYGRWFPDGGLSGPMMSGLRHLLKTNHAKAPKGLAGYGPDDFVRDTVGASRRNGGEPDTLMVSTDFLGTFGHWGSPPVAVKAGETKFGTPITVFKAGFMPEVSIIEAPLLAPCTAVALASPEVTVRNKESPWWHSNRDGFGEWLAWLSIDVRNEHHAAWLEESV